ncbi:hypothetical protein AB4097_11420 [Microvirga sp. 2MCAF35]|uniref:hypothetical protein n=1 Tax=Microvirga sp. 2MCAF35 TaxID=3232987 RepID=UPI003F9B2ACB
MILTFWAHGVDLGRKLSETQIRSVPGLKEAIDAIAKLPDGIGWGEDILASFSNPDPGTE